MSSNISASLACTSVAGRSDMVHVWQIFEPELPQATEAWTEIGRFLDTRTSG